MLSVEEIGKRAKEAEPELVRLMSGKKERGAFKGGAGADRRGEDYFGGE